MAFTFRPAVCRDSVLYELPRPIVSLRVFDAWDCEQFKVPLLDGDATVGHSQLGVDIAIEGRVASQAGTLKTTEEAMFAELEALRGHLAVSSDNGKFLLFLYHDAASETYRHFKSCSALRFDYDLSDKNLFSYSILVHADDPVLYDTEA